MICSGRFSSIGTCTSVDAGSVPEGVGTTSGRGSESMTPATTPRDEGAAGEPVARDTVFITRQAPALFVGEPTAPHLLVGCEREAEKAMRLELPKSSRERGIRRQAGVRSPIDGGRPRYRTADLVVGSEVGERLSACSGPEDRNRIGERRKKDEDLLLELQFRPKLTPFDGSRLGKIRDFAVRCRVRIPLLH
jgi:hypothetical protein